MQEMAECALKGAIEINVWRQDKQMNRELVNFTLDTGAALTTIPDPMNSNAQRW